VWGWGVIKSSSGCHEFDMDDPQTAGHEQRRST
jgi:hypothetical protein